jgi:membrane protease YdiL (CAAX protease family)
MARPEDQVNWVIPIPQALPVDATSAHDGAEQALPIAQPAESIFEEEPVLVAQPLVYEAAADLPELAAPRGGRGMTIISWGIVLPLVGFVFFLNHIWPQIEKDVMRLLYGEQPEQAAEQEAPGQARFEFAMMKMQSRYFVGLKGFLKGQQSVDSQLRALNKGSAEQRLSAIILAGEMSGPSEALEQLEDLEHETTLSPDKREIRNILQRLYEDYQQKQFSGPSVSSEDRATLRRALQWFGDLALAPEDGPDTQAREAVMKSARACAIGVLSAVGTLGVLGLIGLCALLVFAIFLLAGWLRRAFGRPGPYGGIYAETFALWMLSFLVINFGGHYVMDTLMGQEDQQRIARPDAVNGPDTKQAEVAPAQGNDLWTLRHWRLGIAGLVELSTLLVVFWPCVRGVPWREVRHDFGLNLGRKPLAEPFIGLGCYIMSLPLLGVGFGIMLILMWMFGRMPGFGDAALVLADEKLKSHPIVEILGGGQRDWTLVLQVFFLASVVAPIVEEIMFRGVLYRHLRDLSGRLGFVLSLLFSGTVASFIFAVIHPQDVFAFPALMSLAYGFTLAREWRGSVVPGMFMHGLHNGLVMLLLVTILSM